MTFEQARACVIEKVSAGDGLPAIETVLLDAALDRILAEPVRADRDYPSLARSIRDGFAVRSQDLPGAFEILGEVRAGESCPFRIGRRQTVEIMTGAPVPDGADQIVMVEHATRDGSTMTTGREPRPGEFVNPRGAEARKGETILEPGCAIEPATISLLATVGMTEVRVYRKPRVAIVATGDELVPVGHSPAPHQIRNSNAHSLAAQVVRAGGTPVILPAAPDEVRSTRAIIERGLREDLLLVSGGVSAGKYDVVETVLAELGAEFYFDRTLIQPGQPTVFGRVRERFFFGLPGNPASTMVTFRIFAQAALEILAGRRQLELPFFPARLTTVFRHSAGLTRFLPARLSPDGAELTPIPWRGSSDVPAVARANVYLVADAARESWEPGESMPVLLK